METALARTHLDTATGPRLCPKDQPQHVRVPKAVKLSQHARLPRMCPRNVSSCLAWWFRGGLPWADGSRAAQPRRKVYRCHLSCHAPRWPPRADLWRRYSSDAFPWDLGRKGANSDWLGGSSL